MSNALATRIAQEYAAASEQLPPGIVSAQQRRLAIATLASQGLPASRDENWKYANLRALERVRFAPASALAQAQSSEPALVAAELPAAIDGYARYTFVDGAFAQGLSSVSREDVHAIESQERRAAPDGRFALLNDAFANDAAVISVPEGEAHTSCIEVLFIARTEASRAASYPRLQVKVAKGARLNLIERHVSLGS